MREIENSEDGIGLYPTVAKGIIGQWTPLESRIGRWLKGKTIVAILAAHDSDAGPGNFQIAFDDIEIGEPAAGRWETTREYSRAIVGARRAVPVFGAASRFTKRIACESKGMARRAPTVRRGI